MLERLLFTANSSPLTTLFLCLQLDLLPKGTQEPAVLEWLLRTAEHRRVRPISAHLVSSRTGANIAAAASSILVERRGRDIYILGAANVGKSAFVRALVRDMSSWQVSMCAASSAQWCPAGAVDVAKCGRRWGCHVHCSCASVREAMLTCSPCCSLATLTPQPHCKADDCRWSQPCRGPLWV